MNTALKEWAIAVDALTQGDMILLLRKGGIREQGGSFTLVQPQFYLYSTFEHQKPHWLKPAYANRVQPVASGWHPETAEIQAWAEVTHAYSVSEAAAIEALFPFHIWTEAFVTERLKWKPRSPISVLLLRVHRFAQPVQIPYSAEYGGCKSWIELPDLAATAASAVLSDIDYQQQVAAIQSVLEKSNIDLTASDLPVSRPTA